MLRPWLRANSILAQFVQLIAVQFSQSNFNVVANDDVEYTAVPNALSLSIDAVAGNTAAGIVIGTGTTPVTMTDRVLETQVTTNITHGGHNYAVENPDAETWLFTAARTFLNQTGAPLNVTEIGLYSVGYITPPATKIFCVDRTIYPVTVPNGTTLTLTYRLILAL